MAELVLTLGSFLLLWTLAARAVASGSWWGLALGLALTAPTAGFLVRLFVLQHDCGHGALFATRRANDWTGRALGILTLTPYDNWRRSHAVHHASAGHLDRRGIGDVMTLTVAEFRALPPRGRLGYWLYRHPLVMFGLGPAWLFVCQHRLPVGLMGEGRGPWASALVTNLGLALSVAAAVWLVGWGPFLWVQVPVTLMGATAGVWLFYVQHQFEDTHWSDGDEWRFAEAALHGSSNYLLPQPLAWFAGNIGVHHVHHLSSKVPFYRLPQVLRDHPELAETGRVTLGESLRGVRLTLWDEGAKRLVSFREARAAA